MKNFIGKILALASFSLVLATSLHAGMDDRLDTLEKEMQEISARNPLDTVGASFVSAQPIPQDPYHWFFTFDVIYWHPKVGGTEYAYSFEPNIVPAFNIPLNIAPPVDGDVKDNDFNWDWGLKVGLGYNMGHDNWDIYAQYTWFETEETSSTTKAAPSGLAPLKSFINLLAQRAKSQYDIDYNNVDLELGRSYFLSSHLSVRPHIGFKSSWIDLDQDVTYTLGELFLPQVFNGFDQKTKSHLRFWGIGPRAGINTNWHLGYGFSIFGNGSASILYGYFKSRHRETLPPHLVQQISTKGEFLKVKHKFHQFVPYANLYMGLAYNRYINKDKQHLGLKLGYEVQYYWRVNQMTQPEDVSLGPVLNNVTARIHTEEFSEDVMFYGITGEFRLDF